MTALLLDTSAYAWMMRGRKSAIRYVETAPQIFIPTVVVGELLAGFERGGLREKNRLDLDEFCRHPRVETVPVNEQTAERYPIIYAYLRRKGNPIPTNDLWIASIAMQHGFPLLTADKHFELIPQIITHLLIA